MGTQIEWTDVTWNPVTGCDRVSSGCDNCYALTLAKRLKAMGVAKYQTDGNNITSGPGFGVETHAHTLEAPLGWKRPRTIFVNSMSDLFHPKVPLQYVQDIFEVIRATPQHTYQILTKRTHRMVRLSEHLQWPANIWMGATVEDAASQCRIDDLKRIPARVRFLSCEPLLEALPNLDLNGIDWVIVGGESGPRARPIMPHWVTDIRDQSLESNVPFFFKQWGGRTPKHNGRLLEGRTWDEIPRR